MTGPEAHAPSARGRGGEVATVAGAFVAYGAIFFDRLAPLYLVTLIAADLGIPSLYEGTLALLIGLGWAAAMLVVRATSGRLADRDRIVLAGLLAGACSAASALAGSWVLFVALRGLGGLAAASGAPAATSLVFGVSPAGRRGLDLGIVQASTRVAGSLVAPIAVTAVAVVAGWREAMLVSAAVVAVGALLLVWAVPGGGVPAGRAADATVPYRLRPGGRRNVVLCAVACVVLLAWLAIWSQSAVPLVQRWLLVDADAAGRLVGWFGVGSAVAALLVPIASDRLGRRGALAGAAVLGGCGGLAVAGLAVTDTVPGRWLVVLVLLLCGVALGGLPLVISIVPAEAVATGDVGRALMGPIAAGEVLGAAVLPVVAAAAATTIGHAAVLGIAAAGVVALVAVVAGLRPLGSVDA